MFSDPQLLAYAGIGAALFALVLIAAITYPFVLWRIDRRENFLEFLAFLVLPLGVVGGYYLGFNHWILEHLHELSGRQYYLVGAFQGLEGWLASATWLGFAEIVTVGGVGVALAWLLRLLLRGGGRLFAGRTEPGATPARRVAPAAEGIATPLWRRRHFGLAAGTALVLLIACGWAWNAGVIPGNPRAVNKVLVAQVLRESKLTVPSPYGNNEMRACVNLALPSNRNNPELQVFDQLQVIPWAYNVLVEQGNERIGTTTRQQMEVMKTAGFFSQDDGDVEAADGKKFTRYRLTWDGWRNMQHQGNCFKYGTQEVDTVDAMDYRGENAMGVETWDIQFKYKLKDPAPWTTSAQAQEAFPEIRKALAGTPASVQMARTPKGWFDRLGLLQMEASRDLSNVGVRMMQKSIPSTFKNSDALDLLSDNAAFANACVELPSTSNFGTLFYRDPAVRPGFVRVQPGDPVPAYTATVLNIVPMSAGGAVNLANNNRRSEYLLAPWKRLEMLANAGILERTISTTVPDPRNAQAAGAVTYTMADVFQKTMRYADPARPNAFSSCLRLGSWSIDRVSLVAAADPSGMMIKGHATLKAPAAWATEAVAKALPDVDYLLKQGVYFTAGLTMMNMMRNGDNDTPHVQAVTLQFPKIYYPAIKPPFDTIPELKIAESTLAALASQLAAPAVAAAPGRPVKAGSLR